MMPTTQCPLCRGEIHAIASRCKHCKADLAGLREAERRASRRELAPWPAPALAGGAPAAAPAMPIAMAPALAGHAPYLYPSAPPPTSTLARRWPYLVSLIALLAIGVSLAILAQRWSGDGKSAMAGARRAPGTTPRLIPDDMQTQPTLPSPNRGVPDPGNPTPPALGLAPDPGATPDPGAAPDPLAQRAAPGASPVQQFGVAVTSSLCNKLSECGLLDDATRSMCELMADQLGGADMADRVASGECTFDPRAAEACVTAIKGLDCSFGGGSADIMDWLTAANSLRDCSSAYTCH